MQTREQSRKSSRSNEGSNGNCAAVAGFGGEAAVGETESPVADTYAHLRVSTADLGGLHAGIKSGSIT